MLEPLPQLPFTPIYRKKALGGLVARPGEPRLTPKVTGSPRLVDSFSLKSFGGSGELEASLGELWSKKLKEKTLMPPFWYLSHS